MLRKALLVFSLALLALGLGLWLGGVRGAWPMVLWGAVLSAAVLFERWRYAASSSALAQHWQATSERFIDPQSGQPMQVYYNPRTGERRYEPAPQPERPAQ